MNICKNCKFCKDENRRGDMYAHKAFCLKHETKVDSVFGSKEYELCFNINPKGDCEEYEPSAITKIKQYIKLQTCKIKKLWMNLQFTALQNRLRRLLN